MTITAHSSLEKTRKFVFLFCEAESRPLRQRTPCEAPVETQLREPSHPRLHPQLARVYTLAHRERRKRKTGKKKRQRWGRARPMPGPSGAWHYGHSGSWASLPGATPAVLRPHEWKPRPLLPLFGAQPRASRRGHPSPLQLLRATKPGPLPRPSHLRPHRCDESAPGGPVPKSGEFWGTYGT